MNILFVCSGNTCRSPMAEHLFRKMAADAGLLGVDVRSAGTSRAPGSGMPAEAVASLEGEGVLSVRHHAASIDADAVAWADRIFAMERMHREIIVARFPEAAVKTAVLGVGVSDPYGGALADYRATLAVIKKSISDLIQTFKK